MNLHVFLIMISYDKQTYFSKCEFILLLFNSLFRLPFLQAGAQRYKAPVNAYGYFLSF